MTVGIFFVCLAGFFIFYRTVQCDKPLLAFTIADFESERDLLLIKTENAQIEASSSYATSGSRSLCVHFSGGVTLSSVSIEAPFSSIPHYSSWSQSSTLNFTLHGSSPENERLILQIKDTKGARFKHDIYLIPNSTAVFEIPVTTIAGYVDIRNINNLTLFRWNPKKSLTVFLDAIKLQPSPSQMRSH